MEQGTPQRPVEHILFLSFRPYQDQIKSRTYTAMSCQPLHSIPKWFLQRYRVQIHNSQRILFPGALVTPAELEETGKKKSENVYNIFLINTKLKHLALFWY